MQTLQGRLAWPDGTVAPGTVTFDGDSGQIVSVEQGGAVPADQFIVPGFVDTHVHGGGGGDTMDGLSGLETLSRLHLRHGTTTLLPTTMTNPWEKVLAALQAVRRLREAGGVPDGADMPGAHLEGPFISPGRLGAQPPCTLEPTPERVQEVLATGIVRAVTLAPEVPGAFEAALQLARAGVRIGVGHTRADAETVARFLLTVQQAGGLTAATHLYNAMGGIQGREPGPPAALMSDPQTFLEVILDLVHVHPTSFRLACAAAPGRVMLITDAMRAAGQGDGLSELGGQVVIVKNGEAHLENGSLAGSVLTMDVAFRHALELGFPLGQVSRMVSAIPAASVRLTDRGELRAGLQADLLLLDTDYQVQRIFKAGKELER